MKTFLEWLKPGVRVKRYVLLQIISIGTLIYSVISLTTKDILTPKILVAYIALITLSLFLTVFSFMLAQRGILKVTLKNMAYKEKNVAIRRLLYTENMLKKGPKVVIFGGGKGLPNVLSGLKEFTSNITSVISTIETEEDVESLKEQTDVLAPSDIRRSIIALSKEEEDLEKIFEYKYVDGSMTSNSLGNMLVMSMTNVLGGYSNAVTKISDIFRLRGKILPVTMDEVKLCAGLENGEIVVGEKSIRERVVESKSPIKQVFIKDKEVTPAIGVLEAIREADIIVFGPGSLYTSIIPNFLVEGVSKAIVQSKAKKIMITNLMNEPSETRGYTLAKYVNEVERYIGKHVLDYVLTNNGEITEDMMYDLNQGASTPVTLDLENIQNRTISVIQEDLVITAPNAILHDNLRVAEIIIEISKKKHLGSLNLLKAKNMKSKKKTFKAKKEEKIEKESKKVAKDETKPKQDK